MNPLLEVVEVKHIGVGNLLAAKPLEEEGEVFANLLPAEDAVHHVAAEQPQLYLVPGMGVNLFVLMDALEDMGGC